jgi:PAS domain S-box-containing protein
MFAWHGHRSNTNLDDIKKPMAPSLHAFLDNAGSAGRDILAFDWSKTDIGPISTWPVSLQSMVRTALSSHQSMSFYWGPQLRQFYNDAYVPMLAQRRDGIGAPFWEFWSEAADGVRSFVEKALSGESAGMENLPLQLTRGGKKQDAFFTFYYSPLFDDAGAVAGFLNIVSETTNAVQVQRSKDHALKQLLQMFEHSPSFMAGLSGPSHHFQYVNAKYTQLIGGRDVTGKTVAEILPDAVAQGYLAILDGVYQTGQSFTAMSSLYAMQVEVGGPILDRYVDFVFQPIFDNDGTVSGILVEGNDVTERNKALLDLSSSENFLRSVLESSPDCIKVMDLDAKLVFMNEGGKIVMEIDDFETVRGCSWTSFWKDEGNLAAKAAVADAARGIAGRFEGYADTLKGTTKYWDVQVTPIVGQDGNPDRILAVSRDISALKKSEEQRIELMHELAHRMKNSLSLVTSIISQTFRHTDNLVDAQHAISQRMSALSKAQDILIASQWAKADIHKIVDSALAPHRDDVDQFEISGSDVELSQEQGLGLSLALHELATNAAKYGALAVPTGRVSIAWTVSPSGEFGFTWRESGGGTVTPPTRRGFGSRMIERMLAAHFNGTTNLDFDPAGVNFRLTGQTDNQV